MIAFLYTIKSVLIKHFTINGQKINDILIIIVYTKNDIMSKIDCIK